MDKENQPITCGIFYCRVSANLKGCSSLQTSSWFDSVVLRNRQQKHTAKPLVASIPQNSKKDFSNTQAVFDVHNPNLKFKSNIMKLFYERIEHNELLSALENNQTICKSLAYMTTFKKYENLKVVPKTHSIEIFNDELILSIILYVGFENNEYVENVNKSNFQIVSFQKTTNEMYEFTEFSNVIKFIEPKALFYTSLSFATDNFSNDLKTILEIN